jgi:predicted acyltransferase (DUF342 family)
VSTVLGFLMLAFAGGALFAVPLLPAILELKRPRDSARLRLSDQSGRVTKAAVQFRERISPLVPLLRTAAVDRLTHVVTLPSGQGVLLVGDPESPRISASNGRLEGEDTTLFAHPVDLPEGTIFPGDLYGVAAVRCGADCSVGAIYSEGNLHLGERSTIIRWAHSRGSVFIATHSELRGRTSAGQFLALSPGSLFRCLQAPVIFAGAGGIASDCHELSPPITERGHGRRRRRISGSGILQGHCVDDVVTTSDLHVRAEAVIEGDLKSGRTLTVERGAQLWGSVVSAGDLVIGRDCRVQGPVVAESELILGTGSSVGRPNRLTSVCAPFIRIHPGVVVHGTVSARESGEVLAPGEAS